MTTPTRSRAPGMNPEQRREMIVAAALPLLVEHGQAVTTLQIAKAAGIGEATLFRAFTDKDELLDACVAAALRNDHVLAELDAVPLDQPLAARLTEAATTLKVYLDRLSTVLAAVGHRPRRRGTGDEAAAPSMAGRIEAADRTRRAVMRLLEPERDALRLPPETLATIFLALAFPRPGGADTDQVDLPTMVDVFLHGCHE